MVSARSLAFATGFLSLSLEILWIRLFSFANHSIPQASAFVIIMTLIGIALGAYAGRQLCKLKIDLWASCGMILFGASLIAYLSPFVYVHITQLSSHLFLAAVLIAINFFLLSIIFPIVHHLGNQGKGKFGHRIAKVYIANIFGSSLGPLVTSIFLLNLLTTQQVFFLYACLLFVLCLLCQIKSLQKISWQTILFATFCLFAFNVGLTENVFIATLVKPVGLPKRIIENPYGIIVTYNGGKAGDIITGNNVYDGRANLDPVINSNGIDRLIVLAALHDQPKHILMIGLSIGSWLKILTAFPNVESIDVVEINPGYLQAITDYPQIANALLDDRVTLSIDDGRRYVKLHANKKYDFIIMNTTYNWRAYASHLLSKEFLILLKSLMNEHSILSYNSTGSYDVLKTATTLFKHAYLYENFVVAADFDWRVKLKDKQASKKIANLSLDGKALFPHGDEPIIKAMLERTIVPLEAIEPLFQALGRPLEVVTDVNLITEYKYGMRL